ncbi:restriction endonuclease subunit S [Streptomyces sp. NPDC088674]|uniref:restriction endonuclease subunit S n=1 Tax=Streptomyces sp. NPDC088674 TaxID=3365869 RepID=UPI003826932F
MADWKTTPLSDALDFQEGPGIMAVDFKGEGVPLIRLAGLKRGSSLLSGCNYLDPEKVSRKWDHFRLREGDVLLSTSASLGEVATVDRSAVGAVAYTGIIRFRPKWSDVNARFIEFLLTAPSFKRQIEAMGVGSVMKHFGPSHLRQMTVDLPSLADQQAISEVLGVLDDKIAANERIAAAADHLSQAIFCEVLLKSVDGFNDQPLSTVADFINGRAFTKGATGTGRMVVRIAEINSGPGSSTVYNELDVSDQHLARPGDLLFAWSGSLTAARWFRPEAIINQHIFKCIPRDGYPIWLVSQLVHRKLDEFRSIAADKATTMGHIQRRHLDEPVPVPGPKALGALDGVISPLWERALVAEQESLSLATLRDTLLPQLMSGRLRVKDAEKIVEDHV